MKSERFVIVAFAVFAVFGSMLYINPAKALNFIDIYPAAPPATPIQNAINSVQAGQGYNYVIRAHPDPMGLYTYAEYVTIDNTKSGLTLTGVGGPILNGGLLPGNWPASCGFLINQADNVVIEGFTITHYNLYVNGMGIVIWGSGPGHVMNNIIRNNIIEYSWSWGIHLGGASGNIIENNVIQYNGGGIFIDNGYGNVIQSNPSISNNPYEGIELHIAGGTYVYNNIVTHSSNGWGLYADGYSGGLTIDSNTFNNNGYGSLTQWGVYGGGIFVISGANSITSNTVNNNNGIGITIKQGGGNVLYNNHAISNGDYGIAIYSGYNTIGGTPPQKNTAKQNDGAFWLAPFGSYKNWYDPWLAQGTQTTNYWALSPQGNNF